MVARSSGSSMATLTGGNFCRWMLTLFTIFSMGQHRNSRSKMCTTEMNLDVNRRMGLTGFAGLATWYNLCMVPGRSYETGYFCSVAYCPRMTCEPNAMLHLPKLDSGGLAEESNEDDILQLEFRTGWMKRTFGASWGRTFPGCMNDVCSLEGYFHYNSDNFDSAWTQEFQISFPWQAQLQTISSTVLAISTCATFRAILAISPCTIFSAVLATSTLHATVQRLEYQLYGLCKLRLFLATLTMTCAGKGIPSMIQ